MLEKAERSPHLQKEEQKAGEFCAVVGAISFTGRDISTDVVVGLYSLQHRGQDGSGVSAFHRDNGKFSLFKEIGLVGNVFPNDDVLTDNNLNSDLAIGHNRYATKGKKRESRCLQPYVIEWEGRRLAIAHNGNIPGFFLRKLQAELPSDITFQSDTDTEVLGWKIITSPGASWREKIANGLSTVPGSYSLVMATDEGELIGIRDPFSIRPLVYAETPDGLFIASETRGFEHIKVIRWGEVNGGEMVIAKNGTIEKSQVFLPRRTSRCIIEPFYIAFPTSKDNGSDNSEIRRRIGLNLAKEHPRFDVDVICGIPESGIYIAGGYAEGLGLHVDNSMIIKDRYGKGIRSFIQGTPGERQEILELKFSVSDRVGGKKVMIIDDSVIRSATTKILIKRLREKGVKEVHVGVGSPPFVDICDLGVDIAERNELVALELNGQDFRERTSDEIARIINADSIVYLSLPGLKQAIGREGFCTHCLNHEHPIFDSVDGKGRTSLAREAVSVVDN